MDLTAKKPCLEKRARLADALRRFFSKHDFLEVTTPSLIPAPAQEEYIETIPAGGGFLRPSPELEMKIMLASGYERIFQFGPCWRADEFGRLHRREFTMLEYYAAHTDYMELLKFTSQMLEAAALELNGSAALVWQGHTLDLSAANAEVVTVEEAFRRYARTSVADALASDAFDELMVTKIEPNLGKTGVTFLCDYPVCRAALARRKNGAPKLSERWEMYIRGVELGNAFGELTDPAEQKRRFAEAAKVRAANGLQPYPEASSFFQALDRGMPEASGNAIGFDRLAMIFADASDIGQVQF